MSFCSSTMLSSLCHILSLPVCVCVSVFLFSSIAEAEATPKKLSVEQLQEILSDLRLRAKGKFSAYLLS